MEFTSVERRVLGVLIEKALAQPDYYPLTVNSLCGGCNQLSNRDPVMSLAENDVLMALDSLRQKGFATVTIREGGRAERWSHNAAEVFQLNDRELAVIAELLLRGPQTEGELRSHVTRMRQIESIEALTEILQNLMTRESPLVARMPREPGRRGIRYYHLFYAEGEGPQVGQAAASLSAPEGSSDLASRVDHLEKEVADLRDEVAQLRRDHSVLHG
jgi:uncharacterized protein